MAIKTNLEIDSNLIQEAIDIGEEKTEHSVVEVALKEYIQHRQQRKIIELFDTIEYEPDYDYKQQRQQTY